MSQSSTNITSLSTVSPVDAAAADTTSGIEHLRSILNQNERNDIVQLRQQIEALEFRLSDADTRAAESSEVLLAAIKLAKKQDSTDFGEIFKPVVVEQFQVSTSENPEKMAEALFPILGPAIRKMIASMLSPDKNKTKRTYKFEQLFLIEKESGLPICHAKSDSVESQDADMVSGMLSAIQSFVQDAFSTDEFDGLNTLQLGELSVWIEWGPSAVVAAVIRGVAPDSCRTALQQLLEDIHRDYSEPLKAYEGDSAPFATIETDFLLFMENHDSRFINRVRNLPTKIRNLAIAAAVTSAALFAWIVYSQYDQNRWNSFVAQLDAEPGIVVTSNKRMGGQYIVHGLMDPMAKSPNIILSSTNLNSDKVILELEPYQALNKEFIVRRLQMVLVPSAGVSMELIGSELVIKGAKSRSWIEDTSRLARQFNEVSHVTFLP